MKTLIGFNLVCFAISALIILLMYDGEVYEKLLAMFYEVVFMAALSVGVWLMCG